MTAVGYALRNRRSKTASKLYSEAFDFIASQGKRELRCLRLLLEFERGPPRFCRVAPQGRARTQAILYCEFCANSNVRVGLPLGTSWGINLRSFAGRARLSSKPLRTNSTNCQFGLIDSAFRRIASPRRWAAQWPPGVARLRRLRETMAESLAAIDPLPPSPCLLKRRLPAFRQ